MIEHRILESGQTVSFQPKNFEVRRNEAVRSGGETGNRRNESGNRRNEPENRAGNRSEDLNRDPQPRTGQHHSYSITTTTSSSSRSNVANVHNDADRNSILRSNHFEAEDSTARTRPSSPDVSAPVDEAKPLFTSPSSQQQLPELQQQLPEPQQQLPQQQQLLKKGKSSPPQRANVEKEVEKKVEEEEKEEKEEKEERRQSPEWKEPEDPFREVFPNRHRPIIGEQGKFNWQAESVIGVSIDSGITKPYISVISPLTAPVRANLHKAVCGI